MGLVVRASRPSLRPRDRSTSHLKNCVFFLLQAAEMVEDEVDPDSQSWGGMRGEDQDERQLSYDDTQTQSSLSASTNVV